MTRKDAPRQHRHLILVGQEALSSRDDALFVVTNFEGDHGADVQRDPLLGNAFLRYLGFAHRQGEESDFAEERHDERTVPGDHPERCVTTTAAAGNEHRRIWCWNSVTEHLFLASR